MLVKLLASRVQKGEHLHHHLGGDHHQGSFIQKIRFLLWKPIQEADAAWPDWQDHAQLGEAHLVQVESLSKPDERMEG